MTPLALDDLARLRSARSCRRSRRRGRRSPSPGRIAATAVAGISLRRGPPGDRGGRDHGVEAPGSAPRARPAAARLLLRRSARARSRPRSPRRRRRGRGSWRRATLHLLPHGRPHVEAGDDGAEPPRGRDRLQPGDAGAEHEHLRGRDRAGRGRQHREEPRQPVGREQRAPCSRTTVACDESASIGCARVIRGIDSIANADDAARREPLDALRVGQRLEERDQHRPLAGAARPPRATGFATLHDRLAPPTASSTSSAPASAYAASGSAAATPAPRSTAIAKPLWRGARPTPGRARRGARRGPSPSDPDPHGASLVPASGGVRGGTRAALRFLLGHPRDLAVPRRRARRSRARARSPPTARSSSSVSRLEPLALASAARAAPASASMPKSTRAASSNDRSGEPGVGLGRPRDPVSSTSRRKSTSARSSASSGSARSARRRPARPPRSGTSGRR